MSRVLTYPIAFASALCALQLLGGCGLSPETPPLPLPSAEEPIPEEPEPVVKPITRANFDALLYDMTYRDVVDLLGRESEDIEKEYVQARTAFERTELRMWHTWRNPDGAMIRVCFVDNRLQNKSEEGLKEEEDP